MVTRNGNCTTLGGGMSNYLNRAAALALAKVALEQVDGTYISEQSPSDNPDGVSPATV